MRGCSLGEERPWRYDDAREAWWQSDAVPARGEKRLHTAGVVVAVTPVNGPDRSVNGFWFFYIISRGGQKKPTRLIIYLL